MANDTNKSTGGQTPAKAKRAKKPPSAKRVAAEAAVAECVKRADAAKSPQEKTVAESALKAARTELKTLKFKEIASPRLKRAVNIMRQLENVANPNAYTWDEEQADKIIDKLEAALASLTGKLRRTKKAAAEEDYSL